MIELTTPRGLRVRVPEHEGEDAVPRFGPGDHRLADHYRSQGYAVMRGGIAASDCDTIRTLWAEEVKPSREPIYRQSSSGGLERHRFNANGWVMNPILNMQSLDPVRYPRFREFAAERILTAGRLTDAFRLLLGEAPKIVQSMYFEGNSATWEHQDSYYLDSEQLGSMCAAWIALEDIAPSAGRFFVCPGSHRYAVARQGRDNDIADHHENYIQSIVAQVRERELGIVAPALCKGDVLFWNAWTIHGSLDSQDSAHSRASITCHAIADSHRLMQFQTRVMRLNLDRVNGVRVHRPKDLARPLNRAVHAAESHFPSTFAAAKRSAIRSLMRLRRGALQGSTAA